VKPTRREFLLFGLGAPLAAVFAAQGRTFSMPVRGENPRWKRFSQPQIVRYDSECFTIHGRDIFLFGAEFHYPRCPRELWEDRFQKLRRASFNTIETMVFWNYHEREKGKFDFTEFEDFLKLAHEMGLWVIVRPGPYICAEFERGGFPRWVIAQRFPLRSMHPESLKTSKYWYDHVLPIIRRNQITNGGPVILMQIENEYDFWPLPDVEKREYIRFLAHLGWDAGIEVPLITNWTRVVRDQSDPDMARIMDTCDFYPRWNFMKEIPPALVKLRKEQPDDLLGITELQGGWFSQVGGSLSVDQVGVDAAQLNALTKSVLAMGVTYFNYYMGFGGTNFDWAAEKLTTTYDYAAPVREPGGLWEKYYEARGVGEFLKMFGGLLARARTSSVSCESTNSDVWVGERINKQSGVLFVRANTDAQHHFKMTFADPASNGKSAFTVPREGELVLGPRGMKVLPVRVRVGEHGLIYTTAEVLSHGGNHGQHFLIVYDEPNRIAEIALEADRKPHITGETLYQYWEDGAKFIIIGIRVEDRAKFLLVDESFQIIVLPQNVALRTWVEEVATIAGDDESSHCAVPFMTDAYFLARSGSNREHLWADLDYLPGKHLLQLLLSTRPAKCSVNGTPRSFHYDPQFRIASLQVLSPSLPVHGIDLKSVQTSIETFDPSSGQWLNAPATPLEQLGSVPYGYVKYRGELNFHDEPKLYMAAFTGDEKKVFINGKFANEASNSDKFVELDASRYLKNGVNTVEIAYEAFGAPNGGSAMEELKGIRFVRVGDNPHTGISVETWQIQTFSAAAHGWGVNPAFAFGEWQTVSLGEKGASQEFVPAFAWCRAEFSLPQATEGWSVPWKLVFGAAHDALIYLNGSFVGRYSTSGPQDEFFLPEPYFVSANQKNVLTVVLAHTKQAGLIQTMRIEPYEEYSVHRTRVEIEW
jgi:Glycosyl hydrolases family 35/Beta-galactosidase, domain 2/Beta-galactosidase second all-beta domain